MKVVLLCSEGQEEMDCINVGAMLVKLSDGTTVVLNEDSFHKMDLARLDAREALNGWLRQRAQEFGPSPLLPTPAE